MLVDSNYTGANMVFVGGCPRSGTTWLQRMLSCHPNIRTGQEAHIFDHFFMPVQAAWRRSAQSDPLGVGGGLAAYFTDVEFAAVSRSFLISLLRPLASSLQPGELFLEKTPANALSFGEITDVLPDCHVIHVLRDPRDVVASLLAASTSWGSRWAPRNAHHAIRVWQDHVRRVREVRQNLPAWQFLEVRYEELHTDTAAVLRRCALFLGLEWSEAELAQSIVANEPEKAVAENGGTPIPISGGELGRRFGTAAQEPSGFVRKAKVV